MKETDNMIGARRERCGFCGRTSDANTALVHSKANGGCICVDCIGKIYKTYGAVFAERNDRNPETAEAAAPAREPNATGEGRRPFTPSSLKNKLDEYVVGQENAKKALSTAVYNHYKRIRINKGNGVGVRKSNILMLGPTGSGKTYLVETLARILNLPFVIADATSLTAAGYIGGDVSGILFRLIRAAGGNIGLAQQGIVYIDEIDKISARDRGSSRRDVGTEGVQQELLKMLDGARIQLEEYGKEGRKKTVEIDTSNILFICGGAFEGLEKMMEEERRGPIGFGSLVMTGGGTEDGITSEDLQKYGLLPELIGRLPVTVRLEKPDRKALISILTTPKEAIVKQYQALMDADGVRMSFTDGALDKIAGKALEKDLGARGLRTILENALSECMFTLPDMEDVTEVVVTEETVENGRFIIRKSDGEEEGEVICL